MPDDSSNEPFAELPGISGTRFNEVRWFRSIDSTNRYLLNVARGARTDGLVAVADLQLAGRGRLGRTWESPPSGSLLVSVLLRPRLAAERWPELIVAAGLAAVQTATVLCDVPARLKWPNDVVVDGRKLGGLLAETQSSTESVVVGMGFNVDWPALPAELAEIATAVSLAGGRVHDRGIILTSWLRHFDYWLRSLEQEGSNGAARLRATVRGRSATLGEHVRVELPDETFEGVASDLTAAGHLEVRRADGRISTVAAGDVIHLRPT